MTLLVRLFLGDLQLNRFMRFLQATEQRRNWLTDLEIDGAVLDLDDDVIGRLAV